MLLKCLGIVLLATVTVAEIPSYIKICGRKDPNLEKCILSSIEGLREKLRPGIPELDTPRIEPLRLSGIPLAQSPALTAFAHDVNFTGFSDFEIKSFKVDSENKRFNVVLFFKHLILDADYDVKAKVVVPISGRGPIHITTDDILVDVTMQYKMIKKDGKEYMFFPAATTKLSIKDYSAEFMPAEGPESTLAIAINAAIQGGRQEILESIIPTLEEVISGLILKFANNICKHFTFDELFPDRE